ncbi:MAG: division/cell wall cluster transcriptional repressor MraZ [Ruminococcus sp.]|nr:division/cell wall cluster transcriptional repressor MraZ [Ruminococcus sp.]MBQ3946904.1 division/cell wall cluster transcriptional repressor MraZ [Ruminococcus sp.]MBQ9894945.1 division/cell wall cluster transcriptional repressor MraZ [Ruminococcus sp.]MBR6393694.1 division/cell wall cluster transcriptional repressor MraZ [Ruminococcus sp.]MCR5730194.1 division/cell wall cluster transcriptional repressor MraZ [Ruminococcus sp.]
MADPLCGTFYPSIDQKGRMSFPNKLRDILGPEFFLCAGHDDHYIAVYSPEEFESYREKLLSVTGKAGSNVRRFLLSCSDKQVPDKQGRIFIAQQLRDYAGINGEVVVIGAGNRAEIWNKATWDEFSSNMSLDDINAALADLSL